MILIKDIYCERESVITVFQAAHSEPPVDLQQCIPARSLRDMVNRNSCMVNIRAVLSLKKKKIWAGGGMICSTDWLSALLLCCFAAARFLSCCATGLFLDAAAPVCDLTPSLFVYIWPTDVRLSGPSFLSHLPGILSWDKDLYPRK